MFAYTIKDLIKNITATDDDDIDRPRSTRRGGPKKHSIFKNDKSSAITQITQNLTIIAKRRKKIVKSQSLFLQVFSLIFSDFRTLFMFKHSLLVCFGAKTPKKRPLL